MTDRGSTDASPGSTAPAVSESPVAESSAVSGVEALLRIEGQLTAVDAALTRLDDGTYGSCRVCGEPIEDAWLEADPTAESCAVHDQAAGPFAAGDRNGPVRPG